MQIKITELSNALSLIKLLNDNNFGVDAATNARDEILSADIWSEADYDGTGQIGGYVVGRITRDYGSFAKYELMIDSGRVNRARVHGLMTDLLNDSWRA